MAIDDKLVTLGDLKTVIDNTHDSTKQDTLTFDATPTQGSTNPVTSGGIYTGLDGKVDKENGKGLSTNDFTDADKQKLAELSQYVGAGIIFDTASGSIASFSDGGDGLPVKSVSVNVDPVQDTSGGPPSPTNICPITGHAGAAITRVGKNLLNISDAVATGSTFIVNQPCFLPKGTVTFSFDYVGTGSGLSQFRLLGKNENIIRDPYLNVSGTGRKSITSVTAADIYKVQLYTNVVGEYKNFQLEYSSTDTTYEPYQGHVYNVTFPDAAGTAYGGTLDLNAGRLTVDKANIASYSGQSINTPWLSSMDEYAEGRTPTTGAQVVYPLATPVTYSFTAEEITTLLGINHIWADTGDVSVEYAADPKLYINKVIANALNA